MLDILMPVSVKDLPLVVQEIDNPDGMTYEGALPRLVADTDVPCRFCVVVDGGTREDVALLQRYMPTLVDWNLEQNSGVEGIPSTLSAMLTSARNQFIVVVPPHIYLDDPKWFGKMQVVFTKDPHCMIVGADVANTVDSNAHPVKLGYKIHPVSPMFLTTLNAVRNVLGAGPLREGDYWREFSQRAHGLGGTRWVASGVRHRDAHAGQETGTLESAQGSDS